MATASWNARLLVWFTGTLTLLLRVRCWLRRLRLLAPSGRLPSRLLHLMSVQVNHWLAR